MDKAGTGGIEAASGTTKQPDHSYLFLLRLWAEGECRESDTGEQQPQWHGKLQYALGHNARYFHDWPTLVDLLLTMLPDLDLHERRDYEDTDTNDRR